ncbi:hypothetical protein DKX38_024392 [Salix brachista]|uniref:Anthocyanidin 3-O-glucosyltransferase n=1 Tax=Salix brachista TaxID=2182728 RepID=A0A5N5JRX1_9ROSI|nr:hypothetical protein DKX38_024392 [Salix brachista]
MFPPIYAIGPLHLLANNLIADDRLNSIVRPDTDDSESTIFPPEFLSETKDRGMLASWCPQEQILKHPAIGVFVSHMGWNSTLESVSCGVPLLCWPFIAEQQTNCWFACNKWGIGMEINGDVRRDQVGQLIRELMEGERGREMKRQAMEWKTKGEEAASSGGSSCRNFENLLVDILLVQKKK